MHRPARIDSARPAWRRLCAAGPELACELTLACGQAFRWRRIASNEWWGVIGRSGLAVREHKGAVEYRILAGDSGIEAHGRVRDYFHLGVKRSITLQNLYRGWADGDSHFGEVANCFPGVRVLRQEPVECLFSFLCTSCNNIQRITGMISALCETYGSELHPPWSAHLSPEVSSLRFAFPSLAALARADEAKLREMGFGYRARFLVQTAQQVSQGGGEDMLLGLRTANLQTVRAQLMSFTGIGAKVADCISLFSLDQTAAVPIDTHVWRVCVRDYMPELAGRSITPRIYNLVGDKFRSLFGEYAGWAHSVLFAAELPSFRDRLPEALVKQRALAAAAAKEAERAMREKRAAASKKRSPTTNEDGATVKREKRSRQGPKSGVKSESDL